LLEVAGGSIMKRKTMLWLFASMFIIIVGQCDVGSACDLCISGITPAVGAWGETGLDVHIYGNGTAFDETSYAEFIPQNFITVNYTTYVSPTEVIANITINAGASESFCDVHVKSAGDLYDPWWPLVDGFTIVDSIISRVDPSSCACGHTMDVDITGYETQFIDGQSTLFFDPSDGITVNSTSVTDATHATANITIDAGAPATVRNVNVTTTAIPDPHPLRGGFKVRNPVIDSACPSSVAQGQSLVIDVKGLDTAFVDGQSNTTFDPPDGINVISTVVQSEHYASVTIDIDLSAPMTPRDVNVITPCSGVPAEETPQLLAGGIDIVEDLCPSDPAKIDPGVCGCGTPDTDTDSDGTPDCIDGCPFDFFKIAPGQCGCGFPDTDTDGDGVPDCNDSCPNDPDKTEPGACGCGNPDIDIDGDGTSDCNNAGDYSPIADSGPDQSVDSETIVYLDGSASYDPDGTIVSYLWEQTGGPVVGIAAANTSNALFVSPGTEVDDILLTFALTVTDNDGLSSSELVTVTVNKTYDELCKVPPEVISPEDGATDFDMMPVLVIANYIDPVSCISHHNTRWQISEDPDFHGLVYNRSISDHDNPSSHQVPPGVLEPNTTYYLRANIDCSSGCTSEYSAVSSFMTGDANKDANGNGIPDNQEIIGNTDLDGNGQLDDYGNHFKGVITVVGNSMVAIETSENITSLQALNNQDQDILDGMPTNMPWGLINFRLEVANPRDTVQITVYFENKAPNGSVFYKYDPVDGWIDYSEHATFAPNMKSVTIEIQDGGFSDLDGVANAVIVDPCGIGTNLTDSGGGGSNDGCFISAIITE
jgi:hypothetical protein